MGDLMAATAQPSRFVTRVRAEMDAQRLSLRGLARRIDPGNVERSRRNLNRWMYEGIRPGRIARHDVARALGIDPGELDDEEADPMVLLFDAVRAVVRDELRQTARDRAA